MKIFILFKGAFSLPGADRIYALFQKTVRHFGNVRQSAKNLHRVRIRWPR